MTTERQHVHAHASPAAATSHDDLAPGRTSRSAKLDAPSHPIASALILRKAARDDNGVADGAEAALATAASSSGVALPATVMRKFESSLGADLSSVRVHTGPDSAAAAHAVGARAYTVGQDIHFGAGHYDPSSAGGEHLLAHEVAHTVQQQGGAARAQYKLEVSTPFDAAEHEADRAADAMVAGLGAPLASASGVARRIQRDPDKAAQPAAGDDKQWALDTRGKVQALQGVVTKAVTLLNEDATTAAAALKKAKAACSRFEAKFYAARNNFTSHVKAALLAQKQFDEMLKQTFDVVLIAGSMGGIALADFVKKTQRILKVIDGVQRLAGVTHGAAPQLGDVTVGDANVNWSAVVDQALQTLTSYIQQNQSLAAMTAACIKSTRWLTEAIEGSGPKHARDSSEGASADKLAQSVAQAESLGSLNASLSGPANAFEAAITADLTRRGLEDQDKIEQDIALRWLADQSTNPNGTTNTGFGGRGSSDIHAAKDYLEKLGVLGKKGRTGVGVGLWDTDVDDDMTVARAREETAAMKLVGTTGEWQGGAIAGNVVHGHVHAGNNAWKATGPAVRQDASMATRTPGLSTAAGGHVRIESYAIAAITKQVEDAPQAMRQGMLHDLVTFHVAAIDAAGGAVAPGSSGGPAKGAPAE